jgi:hypothetical protein
MIFCLLLVASLSYNILYSFKNSKALDKLFLTSSILYELFDAFRYDNGSYIIGEVSNLSFIIKGLGKELNTMVD